MNKLLKSIVITATALSFTGCVSLTEEQKSYAGEIQEYKSPSKAAGLALLPGVGNLYLSTGKELPSQKNNHMQGALAIVNWATWPVSIVWSVPQAYIDAERINIQESSRTPIPSVAELTPTP